MAHNQGGRANHTGKKLEDFVESTLAGDGFEIVTYPEWQKDQQAYGPEVLVKHVPFTGLYGGRGFSEFVIHSQRIDPAPIRIECKWQQSQGSVDEKLPFTYLNAIDGHPEPWVILLVDGGGFREGAKNWLREAAAERRYIPEDRPEKRIQVMNLSDFLTWANQTFG